jgi:hypothetical protein
MTMTNFPQTLVTLKAIETETEEAMRKSTALKKNLLGQQEVVGEPGQEEITENLMMNLIKARFPIETKEMTCFSRQTKVEWPVLEILR